MASTVTFFSAATVVDMAETEMGRPDKSNCATSSRSNLPLRARTASTVSMVAEAGGRGGGRGPPSVKFSRFQSFAMILVHWEARLQARPPVR